MTYDRMINWLYQFLLWAPGIFIVLLLWGVFGS